MQWEGSGRFPAGWRDFAVSIVIVATLTLFGGLLWMTGNRSGLPLAALMLALAVLVYQFLLTHRYWMNTLLQQDQELEEKL